MEKSEAGTSSSPEGLKSYSSRKNMLGHKKHLWTRIKLAVSRSKKKKGDEAEEAVAEDYQPKKAEQQETGSPGENEKRARSHFKISFRNRKEEDSDLNESFVTFKGFRGESTVHQKWSKLTKNGAGSTSKTTEVSIDVDISSKLQRNDASKTTSAIPSMKKLLHCNQTMLFQPGASDDCPVSPVSFLPSDSEDLKSLDSEVKSTGRVDFARMTKLRGISGTNEDSRDCSPSQPRSYKFNGIQRSSIDDKSSRDSVVEISSDENEDVPRKDRDATLAINRLSRSPRSFQPARQSLRQIFQSSNAPARRSYSRASRLLAGLDRQKLSRRTSSVPKDIRLKDAAPESHKFRKNKKANPEDLQSPWGVKAPSFSSSDSDRPSSIKFRMKRLATTKKQVRASESNSFNLSDDDSDDYEEVSSSTPIVMLQDEFVNYTVKTMKKVKGKGRRMSSL